MRKWLRNWLFRQAARPEPLGVLATNPIDSHGMLDENSFRLQVYKAVNGKVIQIMSYKPNPHGPDWTGEIFVVPDGGDLMETIRIALVSKALK